jgi:enoyl-CoA hydratase
MLPRSATLRSSPGGTNVSEIVTYDGSGSVSTITMNDGKVNCLSPRMLSDLSTALDRAEADQGVVVLTGREGKFSAGFDLTVFERGGDELIQMLSAGARLAERVLSFPFPVVAACSGHALAMGAFLLLCADVRIGADGPYKIGLNEVAIGMTVPHFGIEIARQRLAPAHFNRALITAEIYSPEAAISAGFLDRAVSAADLAAVSRETAIALARLDMSAHAATKLRARALALDALRGALRADFGEE